MSLSKTWYTTANLAIPDTASAAACAKSSLWNFGAMLLGYQSGTNGPEGARPGSVSWTLDGSSDASTAGIDTTDRLVFSGSYTSSKWTRASAGSAHTWFVLKSPSGLLDGPWYLCIDYIGPGDNQVTVVVSNSAFTGGSTTARPTASRESALTSITVSSSTAGAGKTHLNIDANGGFRFLRSRNGTGYFDFYLGIESLVEYHSSDAARSFLLTSSYDASGGALATGQTLSVRGVTSDGASSTGVNIGLAEMNFRGLNQSLIAYTTTNALDSTVDALPSCYVYDNSTNKRGVRGRFPDMWEVGAQVSVGSTFPSSGNPERVLVGGRMIAMSVAPSL